MPSIYDIDFDVQVENLLPPNKRKTKWIAWLVALVNPVKWYHALFFGDYKVGFAGNDWDVSTAYVKGDRVKYTDRSVYELIADTSTGDLPTDSKKWEKVSDIWIGADERVKYNSQKLLLEFALNKWFGTIFAQPTSYTAAPDYYLPKSEIYINEVAGANNVFLASDGSLSGIVYDTDSVPPTVSYVKNTYSFSSESFTILVPLAVYNALASTNPQREAIIRSIADKYVMAGITYTVTTY